MNGGFGKYSKKNRPYRKSWENIYNFATQSTFKMNTSDARQTLSEIKDLMNRSSKFLTLSGSTSVVIGLYACAAGTIGTGNGENDWSGQHDDKMIDD